MYNFTGVCVCVCVCVCVYLCVRTYVYWYICAHLYLLTVLGVYLLYIHIYIPGVSNVCMYIHTRCPVRSVANNLENGIFLHSLPVQWAQHL